MAEKEVKIRITTDASGAITGFKIVRDEVEKTEKHSASFGNTIKQHWVGIAGAAASIGAAWATVSKAIDFAKLGASAQQAEESFKRVGATAGYSTEQMEKYSLAMKKASAGTVDDADAMQKAVKGMALGLKPDDIVKLMEAARRGARLTGEDVKSAYEKITDSIATGMPKALKQYGLATTAEVAIVKAAVKAGVQDVDLLKIALINAAIQAEKMGNLAVTSAEKIQIFNAKVHDVKEQLGIMAITIIDNLLPAMGLLDRELAKDSGATWGKKFALHIIPIQAEVLRLYGLLQQLGGLLSSTRMYLTGPGSALGIESSKKRFDAAAKDYLEYEKNYYDTDKALVALAQKELQLQNELAGKGGKTAGGGADKGAQERIKSLEGQLKAMEDRLRQQTALKTGRQSSGEKGTDAALEEARKAASELEVIGQSQYEKDIARIELQAEKYREAGAGKIAVAKYVAAQTALADAKNTEAMTKKWRAAGEEAQSAMKTEIDAAVRQSEESIRAREKFEQYAKESADVLLTATEHAIADVLDEEKKKYEYLEKLEAEGVITHKEAEEEKRKATEKRIKFEREIESEKFFKVNQDQQDIARNAADAFSALGALYAEDSKERQKLSNLSKAATIAEIALQVQKNLMIAVGAVVTQGTGDPYTAFARIAAMIAVVTGVLSIAGIAFGGGGVGGGGGASATPVTGNTTVLGGEYGQASESLTNSMDMVEEALDSIFNVENVKLQKIYNELRSVNSNITGLVSSFFRTGEVDFNNVTPARSETGFFEKNSYLFTGFPQISSAASDQNAILEKIRMVGLDFGSLLVEKLVGPFLNKIVGDLFGGGKELVWSLSGIKTGKTTVGKMAGGGSTGVMGYEEGVIRTGRPFWESDDYDPYYIAKKLPEESTRLFDRIYKNISDTLLAIGDVLAVSETQIKAYTFESLKIPLTGKSQEEINKTLQDYFSKISDQAVDALFGDILKKYQEAGEGLYETAARIIVDKMTVLNVLEMTTAKYGDNLEERLTRWTGSARKASDGIIALSEELITLAGGLENLTDYATAYYEAFYSDAEKMQDTKEMLQKVFADMDMAMPETRAEYRAIVEGLDLATEADKENYITMLRLAEASDKYYSMLDEIVDKLRSAREDMRMEGLKYDIERNTQARLAFSTLLDQARVGNFANLDNLDKPLKEMIAGAESTRLYKTKQEYEANFYKTYNSIAEMEALVGGQKTVEEKQLDVLKDIERNTNPATQAEAKALADAKAAAEAQAAAEKAAAEAKKQQTATAPKPLTGFTVLTKEQLSQIPAGLGSGWSMTPMTFAEGGSFGGGYRIVGEQGPELEYTGPSQIMSNDKSKFLLNYKELLEEVNALRKDLSAANFQLVKNTNKNLKIAERWDAMFERWDIDGIPEERAQA